MYCYCSMSAGSVWSEWFVQTNLQQSQLVCLLTVISLTTPRRVKCELTDELTFAVDELTCTHLNQRSGPHLIPVFNSTGASVFKRAE